MAKRKTVKKKTPVPSPPVWKKPSGTPLPTGNALAMSIQLSAITGPAVIQLRNGSSELQGTLVLDAEGLQYKRPNQKKPAERKINWKVLGKLMDLGIVTA